MSQKKNQKEADEQSQRALDEIQALVKEKYPNVMMVLALATTTNESGSKGAFVVTGHNACCPEHGVQMAKMLVRDVVESFSSPSPEERQPKVMH